MRSASQAQIWRAAGILPDVLLGAGLIGLDVAARLLPHPPNFSSVAASALFAAAVFRVRVLSFAVPLLALALSDAIIGFDDWRMAAVIYAATVFPAALVVCVRGLPSPIALLGIAACSSVVFFVSTNFGVWAFGAMYPRDLAGLAACYVAALPFFQNTLGGDLFWMFALFGGYQLFRAVLATPRLAPR